MRIAKLIVAGSLLALLTGCANVHGTWTNAPGDKSNPIARVTFANDGTFTAEADYGPKGKQAMSGTWSMNNNKLILDADGHKREYDVTVSGNEMMIGKSKAKMTRMKGNCWCM